MSGASKVTLKSMVEQGRPACPECCGGAGMSVYATRGGTYYHSYATCSGMSGAKAGSLSDALAAGYKRCPRCWGESASTGTGTTVGSGTDASNATANTVMVYATTNGKWYHTKSNCTGMKGARQITLSQAMDEGKTACSTCATTANTGVYSTNSGKYYHKASSCDGMKGATLRTLAEALKKGQTACPVCLVPTTGSADRENAGNTTEPEKVANFTVGKSGIKVYASQNHKYFHTKSDCADVELSHVALETALNYGKKACSKCAASAAEKVYATKNGKYYHITRSCAGSGATSGTLANALAYGFGPCPYCVKGEFDENGGSGTYKSGVSGIKVYAKANGKYYHTKKSCADDGSSHVTLETALNYGLKACSKCASVAERTVYAVKGTSYFHSSKTCAGSSAVKGSYAQALAYGLKACPNCIGGSAAGGEGAEGENNPTDTPEYTAPADSSVYIDLYADEFYYHKAKKCSESGMSGGEEVTLEYALDFGYQKCPHCNPASGVE